MRLLAALVSLLAVLLAGCTASSAERIATKTITTAGSFATKTTVAVVKTSGGVAVSTTKAVAQGGASVVKSVAQMPFVVVRDTATGVARQIPYRDGLRLYAASQTAKFDMALKSFQLLREGMPVVTSSWAQVKPGTKSDPVLKPGDVIQISSAPKTIRTGKHS